MDTLERFLLVATGDEMVGSLDSQTHEIQVLVVHKVNFKHIYSIVRRVDLP